VSTAFIAVGVPIADPIIGLVITALIFHTTWQSWVRSDEAHSQRPNPPTRPHLARPSALVPFTRGATTPSASRSTLLACTCCGPDLRSPSTSKERTWRSSRARPAASV
jgi:hypothetical protein